MEEIRDGFRSSSMWLGSTSMGSGRRCSFVGKSQSCLGSALETRASDVLVVAFGRTWSSLMEKLM
ncbi:hypothetical protein PanWU01x14_310990, partial [Parasponia andersonii]